VVLNDQPRLDGALCPRAWSTTGSDGRQRRQLHARKLAAQVRLAYLDGLGFGSRDKNRFDAAGRRVPRLSDTTFVAEVVERHLFDHERALRRAPNFTREDAQEIALRLSRNWNDTLHATLVGIVLGWDARDGSVALRPRLRRTRRAHGQGRPALVPTGRPAPLDAWADNDRVIFKVGF
jgi:hypothetical protein